MKLGINWPEWQGREFIRDSARWVGAVFDAVYRERELILRSDGKVRYLRLTQRLQVVASVFVIGVFSWAFGMTAVSEIQRDMIDRKAGEIKDAEVAYGDLLDEILTYQEKVTDATGKLQEKHAYLLRELTDGAGGLAAEADGWAQDGQLPVRAPLLDGESGQSLRIHLAQVEIELEQITETTNLLDTSLSKVKARLAKAEEGREPGTQRGDSAQDQIRDLQDQLVKARARAARLDRMKKDLAQNLHSARDSYAQIVQERGVLDRPKRELEYDLGASRARGDSLQSEVIKLTQALDSSREKMETVIGHRSALRALVSRMETQLQSTETRIGSLETDFSKVIAKLEETTGDRDGNDGDVPLSEVSLHDRANILLGRLAELHSSQETVLDQLRLRTLGNVEEAERVVEMAGLDLARVLERAGGAPYGKGGPVVGSDSASTASPALATTLSDVEDHISRWEALKSVLKSLPLISPVDYYHLASRFGKRRDPFTNRWSMHHGLDLAGWKKAPVFATAPGKVVFAGHKGRYGKMVEVDHGNGLRTRYGHLFKVSVRRGEVLGHRHKVGLLGSTGRSTGPHVHYEVLFDGKQIDPLKFIKAGRHVFKSPKVGNEAKAADGEKSG